MRTLNELELDDTKALVFTKTHVCGECGCGLQLAWGGAWDIDDYVVRCGENPRHEGFVPIKSELEEFQSGTPQSAAVVAYHEAREQRLAERRGQTHCPVATLTQSQAMAILSTMWPEAPKLEVLKAAILAQQYGLNPLRGHIYLVKFRRKEKSIDTWADTWVAVLGIRAKRLMTRRVQGYSYLDGPRIMTNEEQEHWNGMIDSMRWWALTKLRGADGSEATGIGNWEKATAVYGTDKGNTPQNMAMIRSESAALQRLCPDEMPADIETIDESYLDLPQLQTITTVKPLSKDKAKIGQPPPSPEQVVKDYADLFGSAPATRLLPVLDKAGAAPAPAVGSEAPPASHGQRSASEKAIRQPGPPWEHWGQCWAAVQTEMEAIKGYYHKWLELAQKLLNKPVMSYIDFQTMGGTMEQAWELAQRVSKMAKTQNGVGQWAGMGP